MINRLIILVGIAFVGCGQLDNQPTVLTVSEINIYMEEIDSDVSLVEVHSDGTVIYDYQIADYYSYKYYDNETKELYKLSYVESTDTALSVTFYYKEDKLIFANAEKGILIDDKYSDKIEQKIYYSNDTVIYKTYEDSFPLDLYKLGLRYLKIHKEEFEMKN
jgi:hypothetical protein